MKKRFGIAFLALLLILAGCRAKTPLRKNIVCRIQIIGDGQERSCVAQEEMIGILNCLRDLGQKTRAQIDPDTLPEPGCVIVLVRTDGSMTRYQIKGERYIRRDRGPWMQTSPQALADLTALTESLLGAL